LFGSGRSPQGLIGLSSARAEKADHNKGRAYYMEALQVLKQLEPSPENKGRRSKIEARIATLE
jgi:hypothetical protein